MNTRHVLACISGLLFVVASAAPAISETPPATPGPKVEIKPQVCRTGPLERTIVKLKWTLYACNDGKTVVAIHKNAWASRVSAITATAVDDRVVVKAIGPLDEGELPAFAALKAMTSAQVSELVAQTKAARGGRLEPAEAHDLPPVRLQRTAAAAAL